MPSRRAVLASAAAVTTVPGCLGDEDTGTGAVTVDTVSATTADAPVRVLPTGLRNLLVEAARSDEAARGEFDVRVSIPPAPELPDLGTIELRGTDGVDGTYSADIEGGNSYRRQYVAESTSSVPENATVVDGESLSADQRAFVRTAVAEDDVRVEPHTALGTWARRTFDGGYVRLDGEVYHGREREQTDAALLTGTVWYVVSLTPAPEADDATVLDCAPVDADAVDALLTVVHRDGEYPKQVDSPSDELRSLASSTASCLFHKLTLDLSVA